MVKKDILEEILLFSVQRAKDEFLIGSHREYELDLPQAKNFATFVSILESIAEDLEASGEINSIMDVKDQMIRAFTFFFDKGVEIGYEYSLGEIPKIHIDFDNIFTGIHGDNIPTNLQIHINAIIPQIVLIADETLKFAHEKQGEYSMENIHILQGIIISGLMLGLEYSLRNQFSISS